MDLLELKSVETESFVRHPWEVARARIVLNLINKQKKSPKSIVDIGSGDAFIANTVAKKYPAAVVTAIDINYSEATLKKLKINKPRNLSYSSDINSIEKAADPIDILLLMDVLEHMEHPEFLLNRIRNLNPVICTTEIFITVPAFQQLFSNHDKKLGHYKRYSRKELISLLSSNGLYNWKGGELFTLVITTLFWMEFKISWYLSQIRIYLPGLTCFCICYPLPS
jgi:hypothetical protein